MKSVLLFAMAIMIALTAVQKANAQSTASVRSDAAPRQMAAPGQKVWVIVNHVKADKRQQFEQFIEEVFWPMAQKLSVEEQRLFRQTRVLYPTTAETDGTYSYLFIMDPFIEGADYEIDHLLKRMYGDEKAAAHGKLFGESLARDQTQYMMVQSKN